MKIVFFKRFFLSLDLERAEKFSLLKFFYRNLDQVVVCLQVEILRAIKLVWNISCFFKKVKTELFL